MMKDTGIIRKVDELGRIVIPKELRDKLSIDNGDSLEVYTQPNGAIVLKKYEPMKDNGKAKIAEIVAKSDMDKEERNEIMKLLKGI